MLRFVDRENERRRELLRLRAEGAVIFAAVYRTTKVNIATLPRLPLNEEEEP